MRCRKCSALAVEGKTQCQKHLDYCREYQRKYRPNYKEYFLKRRQANKEDILTVERSYRLNLRMAVIEAYGGRCVCCGTTHVQFLCVDHINGDGAKHRKALFGKSVGAAGTKFYRWLKANGFPSGFQLLCWNCNAAKHFYGWCPHQQEKTK